MSGYLIVHSGRCAGKIAGFFKALLLGKDSFLDFIRKSVDSMSDAWHDYKAPPATHQRKESMSLVNDGVLLYNSKKYLEAQKTFRLATECDPTYARAYVYLGNTLYKLAEHSDALRAWERALSVEPTSSAAFKARQKIERVKTLNQNAIRDLHEGLKK